MNQSMDLYVKIWLNNGKKYCQIHQILGSKKDPIFSIMTNAIIHI